MLRYCSALLTAVALIAPSVHGQSRAQNAARSYLNPSPATTTGGSSGPAGGGSGVILPAAFKTKRGPLPRADQRGPLYASTAAQRHQQVFLGTELPPALPISGIGFRQDEDFCGHRGATIDVEIRMAFTTKNAGTLTSDFTTNMDSGSPVTVLPRRKVELPDFATKTPGLTVFLTQIAFRNKFQWIRKTGRNLLIDVVVHSSTHYRPGCTWCGNYRLDWAAGTGATTSVLTKVGTRAPVLTKNTGAIVCFFDSVPPVARYETFGSPCEGTAPTRGTTLPAAARNRIGVGTFSFLSNGIHMHQVYRGTDMSAGVATATLLRWPPSTSTRPARTQKVKLNVGPTGKSAATLSKKFADNIDSGPLTTVFDGTLNVPAQGKTTDPHDFGFRIPLKKPWLYAPKAGKNLLLEVIESNPPTAFGAFFNVMDNDPTSANTFGVGNSPNGFFVFKQGLATRFEGIPSREAPTLLCDDRPILGKAMTVRLVNARPSAVAALIGGLSDTQWGSVNLPLTLPGGCQLLVSFDGLTGAVADAKGAASVTFGIPNDPGLNGAQFFNQFVVIDPAGQIGVVLSDAGAATIGDH